MCMYVCPIYLHINTYLNVDLSKSCRPGGSSAETLSYGLLAQRSGGFSLLLHVQPGSETHSASYKMITKAFLRYRRSSVGLPPYLSLGQWLRIWGHLYPHPLWAFMDRNGDYLKVAVCVFLFHSGSSSQWHPTVILPVSLETFFHWNLYPQRSYH